MRKSNSRGPVLGAVVMLVAALGGGAADGDRSQATEVDSCVSCHANPDFLVTNPKLYSYFRDWEQSIHRNEEVTCSDCHGGRPEATAKDEAHRGALGESEAASAVNFAHVHTTCGSCHGDVQEAYEQSAHFEHLVQDETRKQGPSCVTCHQSMNTLTLDVSSVAAACARCHDEERKNHPEIPDQARKALNKFLSIDRLHRYVAVRMEPRESRLLLERIDEETDDLSVLWHTFDLERIQASTAAILEELQRKRDEIRSRKRNASKGSGAAGDPRDPASRR